MPNAWCATPPVDKHRIVPKVGWAMGGLWLVWLRRRQTGPARAEPLASRVPGGAGFRVAWALSWSAAAVVVGSVLVGLLRLPGADVWDDWLKVLFVLGGSGLPAGLLQARLVPRSCAAGRRRGSRPPVAPKEAEADERWPRRPPLASAADVASACCRSHCAAVHSPGA